MLKSVSTYHKYADDYKTTAAWFDS